MDLNFYYNVLVNQQEQDYNVFVEITSAILLNKSAFR
jgi:hypothetical protein